MGHRVTVEDTRGAFCASVGYICLLREDEVEDARALEVDATSKTRLEIIGACLQIDAVSAIMSCLDISFLSAIMPKRQLHNHYTDETLSGQAKKCRQISSGDASLAYGKLNVGKYYR